MEIKAKESNNSRLCSKIKCKRTGRYTCCITCKEYDLCKSNKCLNHYDICGLSVIGNTKEV